MKNLALKFLSESDRNRIDAAIQAAEKKTSGEIVCLVQSASYHYPMANVIGAIAMALPLSLILTPMIGPWLWMGTQNMWVFLGCFFPLFGMFYLSVRQFPWLKRIFISQKDKDDEVEEAAITNFFQYGLYRTKGATGVLVFVSVLERKVWLLADHGINDKINPGRWEEIVASMTRSIKAGQAVDGLCTAVQTIGTMLGEHFPIQPDDENELKNVIVRDE